MNRLLTTVVVGLAGIQGLTLEAVSRPKLVVGIMVDQLRTDYLDQLKEMLGPGGFRRLMDQGLFYRDVDFGVSPGDAASATAIVQTGTYPRYNGVSGSIVYDPATQTETAVFQDPAYIGNFTQETFSPATLRVTTITDEIALDQDGKSKIHSISPDAAQSIILAGHAANSAFWLNDNTGKWATTTYYNLTPAVLQNKNYNSPLISRLDTLKWEPLHKGELYPDLSASSAKEGFKYVFPRSDRDVYSLYKSTPLMNTDITRAAQEYIIDQSLGKSSEAVDVLNLGYTLAPYTPSDNYKFSLQDAYLRLDRDLESLFNTLDKQVGKDNVLVYLVSTGYFEEPSPDTSMLRMPGGTFSVKRAVSLLNSFFSAKYGNAAYVDRFSDDQIYFSSQILEEKSLERDKLAKEAAEFLIKMAGVEEVYTFSDLMNPISEEQKKLRLSLDPKTAGDVVLTFNPGWTVVNDGRFPSTVRPHKSTAYKFPAFIMGTQIEEYTVTSPVKAVRIAPTIANVLRIRPPNSAEEKPLELR